MPHPPHAFSPFLNYYDPSDSMVDIWRGTGLTGDAYFAARNDSVPLIVAAQSDNLALVQQLISGSTTTPPDMEKRGLEGETALHMASALGHLEIVRALIAAGASVDALDEEGSTPLIHAIRFCPPDVSSEIVSALLSAGANPTQMVTVDISQHPPLWFAIKAHNLALVRLFEPMTPRNLDVYPPGSATSRNHIIDAAIIDADSYHGDTSILEFLIQDRSLPLRPMDPAKAFNDKTFLVLVNHLFRDKDLEEAERVAVMDLLSSVRGMAAKHPPTIDLNGVDVRDFVLSSDSTELVAAARKLGMLSEDIS